MKGQFLHTVWWGRGRNLKFLILRSERVKTFPPTGLVRSHVDAHHRRSSTCGSSDPKSERLRNLQLQRGSAQVNPLLRSPAVWKTPARQPHSLEGRLGSARPRAQGRRLDWGLVRCWGFREVWFPDGLQRHPAGLGARAVQGSLRILWAAELHAGQHQVAAQLLYQGTYQSLWALRAGKARSAFKVFSAEELKWSNQTSISKTCSRTITDHLYTLNSNETLSTGWAVPLALTIETCTKFSHFESSNFPNKNRLWFRRLHGWCLTVWPLYPCKVFLGNLQKNLGAKAQQSLSVDRLV